MNYIFSNVYKFAEEKDFVKSLENVGLQDGDTMIFLNQAIPLDHASVFFHRFNIISLHRIHIAPSGEIKWFGEEEMLKRMDGYSQDQSSSIVRIKMFYLDNAGVVKDKNGNVVWHISVNNYPDGKMPMTGFYAYNFALQCLKGGVTLVNFYGSQDSSTNKRNGHDWDYEELVLQNAPHRISISPPDWKLSDVNIIHDATGSVKKVPWRDMGASDIASLWQQIWGEKSTLASVETPKVSVIMPVYNAECYLSEALASVLLQKSIPEVEVICIDDGSRDNSAAILGYWKGVDHRLKVIHQENQGPGVARNVGLDLAKGEYIYFLDADDRIASGDIFLRAYNQAKADKLDVLLADGSVMSENGIVTKRDAYLNRNVVPKEQVFSPDTLGVNLYLAVPMGPAAKLFRRGFLLDENLRFPALKRSEDFPMVRLALSLAQYIGMLLLSVFDRRVDVKTSLESTKDEGPLIFTEAEQIFRDDLFQRGLFDKFCNAANVAFLVDLAYNLSRVRHYSSFRAIAQYALKKFPELEIKKDLICGDSLVKSYKMIVDIITVAEQDDKLADMFADVREMETIRRECVHGRLSVVKLGISRRDQWLASERQKTARAEERVVALQSKLESKQEQISRRDQWLASERQKTARAEERVVALQSKLESKQEQISRRDQWLASERQKTARAEERVVALQSKLESKQEQISRRDQWLASERQKTARAEERVVALQSKLESKQEQISRRDQWLEVEKGKVERRNKWLEKEKLRNSRMKVLLDAEAKKVVAYESALKAKDLEVVKIKNVVTILSELRTIVLSENEDSGE